MGKKRIKKKTIIIGITVIVLLIAAVGGLLCYRSTHISIGGQRYLRSEVSLEAAVTSDADVQKLTELTQLQKLDLRSSQLTAGQYDTLHAALPQCDILWNVPLLESSYRSDTQELILSVLTDSDLPLMDYFPALTTVDARACTDYPQLMQLQELHPELAVLYNVSIGGTYWPQDTAAVKIDSATPAELEQALAYLPALKNVTISETVTDLEGMYRVQQAYPGVTFSFPLEVCGVMADSSDADLDLSGISMENTDALETAVRCMPNLTKVDMCGCGISNEEMEALNNRHEGVLFVWEVQVGFITTRTDAETFMPAREGYKVTTADCYNLRYCTELIALDLGHMKITNCDFVAFMPHLKYLILADTPISDFSPLTGLDELIFLEIFMTGIEDYSSLVTLTALEDLNISYTYGNQEILGQMTWLKRLWWIGGGYAQEYLSEKLPNTKLAFNGLSSTGNGWREGQHYYDMRDIFGMGYMTY